MQRVLLAIFAVLLTFSAVFSIKPVEAASKCSIYRTQKAEIQYQLDNYKLITAEMEQKIFKTPGMSDFYANRVASAMEKKRRLDFPKFQKKALKDIKKLEKKIKKCK